MNRFRITGLLCLLTVAPIISQSVYARTKVKCSWTEHPIVVDGLNEEWVGSLNVINNKVPALGILRDEEFLYLGVLFTEPARQMQILTRGMTVWFDPEGGTEKILGIRFPAGIGEAGMFQTPLPNPGRDPGKKQQEDQGDREQLESELINQLAGEALEKPEYFLILGPEKDQQTQIGFSGSENIEVRAARQGSTLFYELKIPLNRTKVQPFGIGASPGKKLGIGLETNFDDVKRGQIDGGISGGMGTGMPGGMGGGGMGTGMPGGMGGGGMGGGMPGGMGGGGMGGGMPGGMGGGGMGGGEPGGMERPDVLNPLKIWIQAEDLGKDRP